MKREVVLAALTFVITTGTALSTAMVHGGQVTMPDPPTLLVACIGGIVAAASRLQALITEPPK